MRSIALVLALLATPAISALAPIAGVQDDAGSGGDAPDSATDALLVATGVAHEGMLSTVRAPGVRDPVLDQSDWYALYAPAGALLELEVLLLDGEAVTFELRRPDGGMANWRIAEPGASARVARAVTDEAGAWLVHAFAFNSAGGRYRFSVDVSSAHPLLATHRDEGWLAVGVEVADGGSFHATLVSALAAPNAPARRDVFVLREDGSILMHGVDSLTAADGFAAEAPGASVETSVRTHGGAWLRVENAIALTQPGRYEIVALVAPGDAYTFLDAIAAPGSAVSVAASDEVFALRPADFERIGASTSLAEASVGARASVSVGERLVGSYHCGALGVGSCSVEAPGAAPAPVGSVAWGAGDAGVWTFTRERVGGSGFDAFALLAADVPILVG